MGMDGMLDKRGLIEELLKLVSESRAGSLKAKLSPVGPDASMDPEMPGDPTESASGPPADAMGGGDGEPDPELLKKLLEMMGGSGGGGSGDMSGGSGHGFGA